VNPVGSVGHADLMGQIRRAAAHTAKLLLLSPETFVYQQKGVD